MITSRGAPAGQDAEGPGLKSGSHQEYPVGSAGQDQTVQMTSGLQRTIHAKCRLLRKIVPRPCAKDRMLVNRQRQRIFTSKTWTWTQSKDYMRRHRDRQADAAWREGRWTEGRWVHCDTLLARMYETTNDRNKMNEVYDGAVGTPGLRHKPFPKVDAEAAAVGERRHHFRRQHFRDTFGHTSIKNFYADLPAGPNAWKRSVWLSPVGGLRWRMPGLRLGVTISLVARPGTLHTNILSLTHTHKHTHRL